MGKPSAVQDDGEHVAFHSARKGLGHMLLMRTSLATLRGHLPPVVQPRKRSVQRGTIQALWRGMVHIPVRQGAGAAGPIKLSGRLGL